jgi:hypothetical protein
MALLADTISNEVLAVLAVVSGPVSGAAVWLWTRREAANDKARQHRKEDEADQVKGWKDLNEALKEELKQVKIEADRCESKLEQEVRSLQHELAFAHVRAERAVARLESHEAQMREANMKFKEWQEPPKPVLPQELRPTNSAPEQK